MSRYVYAATVVRWVDGDTVDLRIDLGFRMTTEQRFRLLGVNTPERGQPGAAEATAYAERHLPPGTEVVAETHKTDKYGRWLVELRREGAASINLALLRMGHAVAYDGGRRG